MKFLSPTIEDAKWAVPLLEANNYMASEYAFTNVFMWQDYVDIKIARFEDFVMVKADYGGDHINYQYPAGKGDMAKAIKEIILASQNDNRPPAITSIPDEGKELLEDLFPDTFTFTNPRGNHDYIYLSSDLADLPGKKFQKKRNHCSRFERDNPNWEFKLIDNTKINDISKFTERWLNQAGNVDSEGIKNEMLAIKRAMENYEALNLMGGYLEVDDEIVAYSYGRPMGDEFIAHVEKAMYDVQGAYAVINREIAKSVGSNYKYINREDDVDEEGLRKSKLSYRPVFLINKWRAQFKEWPPQI